MPAVTLRQRPFKRASSQARSRHLEVFARSKIKVIVARKVRDPDEQKNHCGQADFILEPGVTRNSSTTIYPTKGVLFLSIRKLRCVTWVRGLTRASGTVRYGTTMRNNVLALKVMLQPATISRDLS
jgi:hypothetical protein